MICSLNEVEAYGRRAARGAGMSWGLAEEAGKAARWLAERDLPAVELLARLLAANDGRPYSDMAPVIDGDRWRAPGGELCPVCCGAALCDRIDALSRGHGIRLVAVACPLLLAPFLDGAWQSDEASCEIRWPNVRLLLTANGVTLESDKASAHMSDRADEVEVSFGTYQSARPTHQPRAGGIATPRSAWHAIDMLAKRTYVPASDESRARGAGAGRTDND